MRRIVLMVMLAFLLFSRANAQTPPPEFGIRLGFQLLILPEIHFGLEARNPESGLGMGVRTRFYYLILIYGFGIDAYGFVPLSSDWDIYFGVGWTRLDGFFNIGPVDLTYGILGVRLRQGFFVEVTPGIASGIGCTQSLPPNPCVRTFYQSFFILGSLGFAWRL